MTKLQALNRKILELKHNGNINESEYGAYKLLLDAHLQLSRFVDFLDTASGDNAYEAEIQIALKILEELT